MQVKTYALLCMQGTKVSVDIWGDLRLINLFSMYVPKDKDYGSLRLHFGHWANA